MAEFLLMFVVGPCPPPEPLPPDELDIGRIVIRRLA
jgi:hypothetical protein